MGNGVLYGFRGAQQSVVTPVPSVCISEWERETMSVCVYHLCSIYFRDLASSFLFVSGFLPFCVLYEQPLLPPVSNSICLSVHLELLSEFNLTALWQI